MKIFHGIIEIAGQMGILSGALKRKGHLSVGYNTFHSYLGYKDHLINTDWFEIQNIYKPLLNFFDVYHFHYGSTILDNFADLPILAGKGKKMVMHHWGNDVRFHDKARERNPYVFTGDSPPNEEIHQRLSEISKYIKEAIVQDYEVLPYVEPYYEKVHVVPIAVELARFQPVYPALEQTTPLILHAPTNPEFKGTASIEQTLVELKKQYPFRYRRIEQMSNEEALRLYAQADIIIDQIRCGSHGLLSVEAMALGKPVVAYIRDDLAAKFPPDLPIVNANPDTLYEQLKKLLEQPELRQQLGIQGRQYVEKYHASDVVVEQLLAIYENLPH
ncbi:glycosyltransferase family protein [Brevibacillus fulvus]|uniref:Glycosyltransferase involved in cell wall biosynthesis n=1 Tax=Brevibacillus fulvus TaxID=1125967 RepID=A0A939BNH0_9BACL|nr:glycosyltransferase involved in cell wall biosynthesis [Brevibacillus fulvus]